MEQAWEQASGLLASVKAFQQDEESAFQQALMALLGLMASERALADPLGLASLAVLALEPLLADL